MEKKSNLAQSFSLQGYAQFTKVTIIAENLKNELNIAKLKLTFKGDLDTYRFCDDVWTFIIKNVLVKMTDLSGSASGSSGGGSDGDLELHVDKFKIVACNARKAGEP